MSLQDKSARCRRMQQSSASSDRKEGEAESAVYTVGHGNFVLQVLLKLAPPLFSFPNPCLLQVVRINFTSVADPIDEVQVGTQTPDL